MPGAFWWIGIGDLTPMRYKIAFSKAAARDMQRLTPAVERRISGKIAELADDLHGDVKRLRHFAPRYRLRRRGLAGSVRH